MNICEHCGKDLNGALSHIMYPTICIDCFYSPDAVVSLEKKQKEESETKEFIAKIFGVV
jgi:hypothetical protein